MADSTQVPEAHKQTRLALLLDFLRQDPDNLNLLADAANAAYDEDELDTAAGLLVHFRELASLPLPLINLEGLIALRSRNLELAAASFDVLIHAGVQEPSVLFNRAWVHALHKEYQQALTLLGDQVTSVSDRAPSLKVQMLHHLGQLDQALAEGVRLAEQFPTNDGLLGAMAIVAMDEGDMSATREYAYRGKGGTDVWIGRGYVALEDGDLDAAQEWFDTALGSDPVSARAWVGRGLGLIAQRQIPEGIAALSEGAKLFEHHLGSWIALGWAQLVSGAVADAKATFDHAMQLDENFAETHGALAVLDILKGDLDSGKRRTEIAFRLDRNCFGAMLANLLLQEAKGNRDAVSRIWGRAMNTAIGSDGRTLGQAMVSMGLNPGGLAKPGQA